MTKTRKYEANIVSLEDSTKKEHVVTGIEYRPEPWAFRKVIKVLSDKYPDSPATDIQLIITGKPYHSEEEWYDGYSTEIQASLWQLYLYYERIPKHDRVDTVCMWVVRNFHYCWLHGPKVSGIYRPRKVRIAEYKLEAFRDQLVCTACGQVFTYPGLKTDERITVMRNYNKWLQAHVEVCTVVHQDVSSVLTRIELRKQAEVERKAEEERKLREYEAWKQMQRDEYQPKTEAELDGIANNEYISNVLRTIEVQFSHKQVATAIKSLVALSLYSAKQWDVCGVPTNKANRDLIVRIAEEHGIKITAYGTEFPKERAAWLDKNAPKINPPVIESVSPKIGHRITDKNGNVKIVKD